MGQLRGEHAVETAITASHSSSCEQFHAKLWQGITITKIGFTIMQEKQTQFDRAFSASDQAGVAWEWSVDWLAKQHSAVPGDAIVDGIIALGFVPSRVVDGIAYFNADHYAALQRWLLDKAKELTTAPLEPSAEQRQHATRDPFDLLDELATTTDQTTRRDLVIALAVSAGARADESAQRNSGALLELLERIATGDLAAIDKTRLWLVENIITITLE